MQFAGQRTDENLHPIGDPVNVLVKLSDDILPDPGAVQVTGITPQATLADGLSEPEFCRLLMEEVFTPNTITVGFNNVRFDDEFIRHTFWRNFHDPYEWAWSEGRSRWDLLDVVRMTRALRPEGINWPVDQEGRPTNRLELLSAENGLVHTKAHDALSDVEALIAVTRLIREKQPRLYDYLLKGRDKRSVAELVNLASPQPFVYSSGRYDNAHEKTTVAFPVAPGPKPNSVLVYDLRHDPTAFSNATPKALAELLFATREQRQDPSFRQLPVKELVYNKCPAVAPLGVLDESSAKRIGIDSPTIRAHLQALTAMADFGERVREAFEMREPYAPSSDPEEQLYDGFINEKDKPRMSAVRAAGADELADFHPQFADERLSELLLRYKARSYPAALTEAEQQQWESFRVGKLKAALPAYLLALQRSAQQGGDSFILEELQLWAESIAPADI